MNVSASMPRKAQTLFPAWRLKRGVAYADDTELQSAAESCEQWGWWSGVLIVLGVVAEFALAAYHPTYDSFWSRWGSALATLLVAFGVACEVQFSRMGSRRQGELADRASIRLAEAEEQLAEAWRMAEKAGDQAYEAKSLARDALGLPDWNDWK